MNLSINLCELFVNEIIVCAILGIGKNSKIPINGRNAGEMFYLKSCDANAMICYSVILKVEVSNEAIFCQTRKR